MARMILSGFEPEPLAEEYTEGIIIVHGLLAAARPELPEERYSIAYLHMVAVLASLEQRCDNPHFSDEEAYRVVAELYTTMAATLAAPPAASETWGGSSRSGATAGDPERRQGLGLIPHRRESSPPP
jgi:hypothetical protein